MHEYDPLISTIVPVFNVGSYIDQCIKSILAQSFSDFELIIVDDGSTDNTYDICKSYADKDSRIKIYSQENHGVVHARRIALSLAKGQYVTFVDGDDWIEPDMIQIMLDNIGAADMLCGGIIWEEKRGVITKKRDSLAIGTYKGDTLKQLKSKMLFDADNGISQSLTAWMFTKLFKADRLRYVEKYIDESVYFYEDALLVYRYALSCDEIVFVDEYSYHYRFRSDSASHRMDDNALSNINNVYRGLLSIIKDESDVYGLRKQADNWLIEKCYFTLNERMGLKTEGRVIRYLLDQSGLRDKKIALYGAGRVGMDIYVQLRANGRPPVLWVDKRANELGDTRIQDTGALLDTEFDIVLIAIENREMADTVRDDLIKQGIPEPLIAAAKINKLF